MSQHPTTRRRLGQALALVAAGLVGGLGATAANASFSDVPDEGNYTEHITNLQEAGIATGFSDGSFRPAADMNRRQTAAWIDRAAGRVGLDLLGSGHSDIQLDGANPTATLNEVEMTSPAAGDGGGWVTLQGGVGGAVLSGEESCPCVVRVWLRDSQGHDLGTSILTVLPHGDGLSITTAPVMAITPLASGVVETYRLDLELLDPSVAVAIGGSLSATYSPLADTEPDAFTPESGGRGDPTESLVPEIDFTSGG
jgi:hypothetical protein